MSQIIDHESAVSQVLNEAASQAADAFTKSIRPIYLCEKNKRPVHVGTGTLLSVRNRHYLITAAHVLDQNNGLNLSVGLENGLVGLQGQGRAIRKVDGSRRKDHYDFAWIEINPEELQKFEELCFIPESNCLLLGANTDHMLISCVGYPSSKNKKTFPIDGKLHAVKAQFSSIPITDISSHVENGYRKEHHILIGRDKKTAHDENGVLVNTFETRGMSGGAAVCAGNIGNPATLAANYQHQPKLAGIIIEYSNSAEALVGVRVGLVLNQILRNTL